MIRQKTIFTKRIGTKCRLIYTRTEQINDHTGIMHKNYSAAHLIKVNKSGRDLI